MPQVTKPKPMDNQLQTANWTSAYSNWIPDSHSLCNIIHFYYSVWGPLITQQYVDSNSGFLSTLLVVEMGLLLILAIPIFFRIPFSFYEAISH